MAIYGIGATWNPAMSRYNRGIKRALADVKGLDFAYRLNQWGPKVGPPMVPANIASAGKNLSIWPFDQIAETFGFLSPQETVQASYAAVTDAANGLPTKLSTLQNYLTQLTPYNNAQDVNTVNRAQALESQTTGLAGVLNNLQTAATQLLGNLNIAQGDSTLDKDGANALKTQADNYLAQVSTLTDSISSLGSDIASFLKNAGASSSVVSAVENTLSHSVGTLTWIIGGSLAAYFLIPSFLPRVAGGLRKAVRG